MLAERWSFAEVEEFWAGEVGNLWFCLGGVENSYYQPKDAGPFGPVLQRAEQQSKTEDETEAGDEGVEEEVAFAGVFGAEGEDAGGRPS